MGEDADDGGAVIETDRPHNYAFVLPQGWLRIDLDRRSTSKDIDAILSERFAGYKQPSRVLDQLRSALQDQASAARVAGGVELCLSVMTASPLAVPAALLVSLTPPSQDIFTASDLAVSLGSRSKDDHISTRELPAGRAVRRSATESTPALLEPPGSFGVQNSSLKDIPSEMTGFNVAFYVGVPASPGQFLCLNFSSPVMTLRESLTELFDAIAETLRWVE